MEYLQDDIIIRSNMADITNDEIITNYLTKFGDDDYSMAGAMEYIHQLDAYDKLALSISIRLLKSSFDLFKSNGYIEWEKRITCKKEKLD